MDLDKAFEADNGFLITDGPFYTGGTVSPIGLDLPTKTLYLQETVSGVLLWRKFNTGVNDWRQLSAQDIPFDPTGSSLISTDLDAGLKEVSSGLDAVVFGLDADDKTKAADETTTGSTFNEYDSLTFNVSETTGTNKYRCNIAFCWGHDSGANDIRVRLMVDGVQQGEEFRVEPKDAGGDQRIQNNILRYVENLSQGSHTLSLEYRPAVSSRTSRMYHSTIEVWRTK